VRYDYGFFTIFFGVGAFIFALTYNKFKGSSVISFLAQSIIGIYVIHMFVLRFLSIIKNLYHPYSIFWDIAIPFIVFASSLGLVVLLRKNSFTRRLVA